MAKADTEKLLPLSEQTYYIMLTLVHPIHGYGIMQKVEAMTNQIVKLGPGTLYGVLSTLDKQGLIVKVREEDRRKVYQLTEAGYELLKKQYERIRLMEMNGKAVLR